MKIHNLLINVLVYVFGITAIIIGIDFFLESATKRDISNIWSFYPGLALGAWFMYETFDRCYRLVDADTILLTYNLLFNELTAETKFNGYPTGLHFTNMLEIDEAEIPLKNTRGILKDFKVSTLTSHILIEILYEWEIDINRISVLYRNAENISKIIKDINSAIETVIKSTTERVLSKGKSLDLVTQAEKTFSDLRKELLKQLRKRQKKLGIKIKDIDFGNIDLSDAESNARVNAAQMKIYNDAANDLSDNGKKMPHDVALKIVMAIDGKANLGDNKLTVAGPDGMTFVVGSLTN